MNNYLIPANSKKSMLIFGLFNTTDLWIVVPGVSTTLLLLMILPIENIAIALIAIAPGVITSFLVLPVPNYHNVRTFIKSVYKFYTSERKLIWKGWCFTDGKK